jgi:gluconolactonase
MDFETVCYGLRFPEGPVWMLDGSVIVVEIEAGRVTRILPDGRKQVVATPGGGPNGAAIGPDGALYVCNNGGMACFDVDGLVMTNGSAAADYETGRIERIDLATGKVERLYDRLGDRPLWGPNDIVFDADGGMWFSDFGKHLNHAKNDGGIFYARPDGSLIKRAIDKLNVNGIGLSPDGRKVYAALTDERLVLEFDVIGPGELSPAEPAGRVVTSFPGREMLDSFAVTQDGHICVGTLFEKQGITSIDPATGEQSFFPFPDFFTTNICFGGADMRDAWVTLSTTGKLVKVRWPKAGHRLAFYA